LINLESIHHTLLVSGDDQWLPRPCIRDHLLYGLALIGCLSAGARQSDNLSYRFHMMNLRGCIVCLFWFCCWAVCPVTCPLFAEDGPAEKLEIDLPAQGKEPLYLEAEVDLRLPRGGILNPTNAYSGHALTSYGIQSWLYDENDPSPKTFGRRTAELFLLENSMLFFLILGHEGGHYRTMVGSGKKGVTITLEPGLYLNLFPPLQGAYVSNDQYSIFDEEKNSKMYAAGITANNQSAEEIITRSLGKKINLSEVLWYFGNQISYGINMLRAGDPSASTGLEKELGRENVCCGGQRDIGNWLGSTASFDCELESKLLKDLKTGNTWQGLSLPLPLASAMGYWLFNKESNLPDYWAQTQSELTDRGVLYNLDVWWKNSDRFMSKVRVGYGNNRFDAKNPLWQVEMETFNSPVTVWGTQLDVALGVVNTKKRSYRIGGTFNHQFDKLKASLVTNAYTGYHRLSPIAIGGWNEVKVKLGYAF